MAGARLIPCKLNHSKEQDQNLRVMWLRDEE